MVTLRRQLVRTTTDPICLVDLTGEVLEWVRSAGVRNGLLTVTSMHTTARITCNERDPALQQDMIRFLERLVPADAAYGHNRDAIDGRANTHAHLLGLLMPTSEAIPVIDGHLALGAWQSIFLVELDGPRDRREILLQVIGE
jgi:secondary thiamine-phosphate synthase enzyme